MDSKHLEVNRRNWESRVPVHMESEVYAPQEFVRTRKPKLGSIERQEVGPVDNKALLHLQCHIGTDTLSWALLGAKVTGVDFSPAALEQARSLADQMQLPARFIEAEVQTLDLGETFDVVFASAGVLCWIEDVERWMKVAAKHLKPGGVFYLFDGHPIAEVFDRDGSETPEFSSEYHYFDSEPTRYDERYSYTGGAQEVSEPVCYFWHHPLSRVVQAAIDAGLTLQHVREHPQTYFQRYPFQVRDGEYWRMPGDPLPLTYSIKATKL
jgi:SAM-dependent methyltransferase